MSQDSIMIRSRKFNESYARTNSLQRFEIVAMVSSLLNEVSDQALCLGLALMMQRSSRIPSRSME